MRETPRPQGTAGDARSALPRLRPGRALAHNTGAVRSGNPHRSDVRPPQTPRGARDTGRRGRSGTTPPVPGRPLFRGFRVPGPGRRHGIVALVSALLFGLTSWQVAAHGAVRALDERLGRGLEASAVPGPLAQFLADLGNTAVALPVLLVAAGWALWRLRRAAGTGPARPWLPPLAALGGLAAVPALVVPFKVWLDRPGPPPMAGSHEGFYPSGHGATAAVAYGLAALLLARAHRRGAARREDARPAERGRGRIAAVPAAVLLATGTGLLNAGVGLGLVRQGYHWPLDVLGSWCLAGVLLPLWCAVCDRWGGRSAPDR
ncbi:phosphatase PAP2 family protein [Streptomyces sp. GS7]|nr:phosphatase PAP2 family protein [Streptomyces sp. GS7]